MWASMMSVIAWLMSRDRTTDAETIRVMHFWTLLLLLISAGLRPFSPAIPGSAGEISPLLQTDLMVIHPPVDMAQAFILLPLSAPFVHDELDPSQ